MEMESLVHIVSQYSAPMNLASLLELHLPFYSWNDGSCGARVSVSMDPAHASLDCTLARMVDQHSSQWVIQMVSMCMMVNLGSVVELNLVSHVLFLVRSVPLKSCWIW